MKVQWQVSWDSILVNMDCRAMSLRQKGIHLVSLRVEGDGVRALFSRHSLDSSHRLGIEYVNHPWIADGDVQMLECGVEYYP
jgi:hypothetical protein